MLATDWVTVSSLATAGATLVLAFATFASVKWVNRAVRVAERSLLAGLRPVLMPSRPDDPPQRVGFSDDRWFKVPGSGAVASDPSDPAFAEARAAIEEPRRIGVEILYGDHELGRRAISLFSMTPRDEGGWLVSVARHWNVDGAAPR